MNTENNISYQSLIDPGYIIFERSMPSKIWFNSLYQVFDELINKLSDEHIEELRNVALNWLKEEKNDSYFCGVPSSFRDRSNDEGKRNKIYLQYSLEFTNSQAFANTWIAKQPEMILLVQLIKEIEKICDFLFKNVLNKIIENNEFLSDYFDFDRPLPIIIKLVRYNKHSSRFATDPHYDKSALSILVDADDDEVKWRVGKGTNTLLSEMTAPLEYAEDSNALNDCILFSGLCLKHAGVDLLPAPHYVMPVETKQYRHSVIAFLLIPNLPDTDKLNTQASYIQDILKEVK